MTVALNIHFENISPKLQCGYAGFQSPGAIYTTQGILFGIHGLALSCQFLLHFFQD
jgi:hypothetical protein